MGVSGDRLPMARRTPIVGYFDFLRKPLIRQPFGR